MNKQEIRQVILRVVLGLTFCIHGLAKFQGGISNTAGFFDSLGIPGILAYAAAFIELAGGIALILGIGIRVVALLFVFIMAGTIVTAKLPAGFLGNSQMAGYELDVVLLAMSLFFVLANKTALSLDNKLFNSTKTKRNTSSSELTAEERRFSVVYN